MPEPVKTAPRTSAKCPETGAWLWWTTPEAGKRLLCAQTCLLEILAAGQSEAFPAATSKHTGAGIDSVLLKEAMSKAGPNPVSFKTAGFLLGNLRKWGALSYEGSGKYWSVSLTDKGRELHANTCSGTLAA